MDYAHIADQLLTVSTALAGLILVFLGNSISGYASYDAVQQASVRSKYRVRTALAVVGFVAALVSALGALRFYWIHSLTFIHWSVGSFLLALGCALVCAAITLCDLYGD